jgi:hypothetical protein
LHNDDDADRVVHDATRLFFAPPLVEEEEENRSLSARRKTLSVLFYFCNLARNENEAHV